MFLILSKTLLDSKSNLIEQLEHMSLDILTFQLIHLLVSERKATKWLSKVSWKTPIKNFLKQRETVQENAWNKPLPLQVIPEIFFELD